MTGLLLYYLAAPLAAAVVNAILFRRNGSVAAAVSTLTTAGMLIAALLLLKAPDSAPVIYRWIELNGGAGIDIALSLNPLNRGLMLVVAIVGLLVHIFSTGYMKDDPSKGRFFACLSLFMFSMAGILLADNFAMMFMFWELVGASSYLLIGFWFRKDSAAEASKKAFITNRIGDFGFLTGIGILFAVTGTFEFDKASAVIATAQVPEGWVTLAACLIFCGAIGKSAQLPLHVWLPDAMEGPTPVSALIHAATMVAAGVFMLAKCSFLFAYSEFAAGLVTYIGAFTALAAALIATQQSDIKRILAYSTMSQLGYMVMAVGLLEPNAGMFHLFTHAFFKALLFLGAGAVIHALHHEQDIWKMGGLAKKLPLVTLCFGIGMVALMALPPMSGFFSKDTILEAAAHGNDKGVFWIALIVAFLTPYYMMRLFTVAFLGRARSESAKHPHAPGLVMTVPLMVLAFLSIVSGLPGVPALLGQIAPAFHVSGVMFAGLVVSLLGALLGWLRFRNCASEPEGIPVLRFGFFFDHLYAWIVRVYQNSLAHLIRGFDVIIMDGLMMRFPAWLAGLAGGALRQFQRGQLQYYALLFGIGVALLMYLGLSFTR